MTNLLASSMPWVHAAAAAGSSAALPLSLAAARLLSSIGVSSWQASHHHADCQQQPQPQQQQLWPAQMQLLPQIRCMRSRAGSGGGGGKQQQQQQQQQHQQHHPPHRQRQRPGAAPSAADLTAAILSADSPRELLERVVLNHQQLDHTHIITALQRATQLWPQTAAPAGAVPAPGRRGVKHWQQQQQQQQAAGEGGSGGPVDTVGRQQLAKLMLQLSGPFIRALPDYSGTDIASGLWSYSKCGLQPPAELLHAAIQDLCSWDKLQQAQPSTVANLAWAASKLGCKDKQLFSHIAVAALSGRMQRYTPSHLASLAWSLSRAYYQDRALGLCLTARAVELLQRQQRQQQQQQQQQQGKPARLQPSVLQQSGEWRFAPTSLAGVLSSSATMGWLHETPELIQRAAEVSLEQHFVRGFKPVDAANFMWGLATTLGGSGAEQHHQQQQQQQQQQGPTEAKASSTAPAPAASSGLLDVQVVWQASLGVAAAALRRTDEAAAGSLCRMVWACAILSQWVLRRLAAEPTGGGVPGDAAAAQQAVAEGRVVFDQLCTALGNSWQQQPHSFAPTVAMTVWGLIAADRSGLWRLDSPSGSAVLVAVTEQQIQQQQEQGTPPTLLLQHLLDGISTHRQQQQLTASTVGDLAVALAELKRRVVDSSASVSAAASCWVQEGGEVESAAVQQGGRAGQQQLQAQFSAAVNALAAAAWQHAGTPGALEVRDVSRMLTAFSHLQVDDTGLYRDLLQHWSQEALQGCSSRALMGALHAAATFTAAQPELMQSGSLPVHAWEHLMTACKSRWQSLSADEQLRVRWSVLGLCSGLKGVLGEELLLELSEAVGPTPATDNAAAEA